MLGTVGGDRRRDRRSTTTQPSRGRAAGRHQRRSEAARLGRGPRGHVQAKSAAAAAYAAAEHEAREQGLSGEGVESVAETVRHKVETVARAATEAAKQKAGFGEQEPAPNQDASRYGQAGFQDRGDGEPT